MLKQTIRSGIITITIELRSILQANILFHIKKEAVCQFLVQFSVKVIKEMHLIELLPEKNVEYLRRRKK